MNGHTFALSRPNYPTYNTQHQIDDQTKKIDDQAKKIDDQAKHIVGLTHLASSIGDLLEDTEIENFLPGKLNT